MVLIHLAGKKKRSGNPFIFLWLGGKSRNRGFDMAIYAQRNGDVANRNIISVLCADIIL
jgi:hypothetical protein